FFFFFSSRRRHTRFSRDWSSDVCSSDLIAAPVSEFGDDTHDETMVATVAERLGIDPSRASRLVSEMVEAGYARRAVSQADARRKIGRASCRERVEGSGGARE